MEYNSIGAAESVRSDKGIGSAIQRGIWMQKYGESRDANTDGDDTPSRGPLPAIKTEPCDSVGHSDENRDCRPINVDMVKHEPGEEMMGLPAKLPDNRPFPVALFRSGQQCQSARDITLTHIALPPSLTTNVRCVKMNEEADHSLYTYGADHTYTCSVLLHDSSVQKVEPDIHSRKGFRCSLCSYSTATKVDLIRHVVVHTEAKRAQDPLPNPESHECCDTRETPYNAYIILCPHCPYGAFLKDDMAKHILSHSEEKVYDTNKGVQTSKVYYTVQNLPSSHSKVDVSNVKSAESNPTDRKPHKRSHYPHGAFVKDDSATHLLGHSDEKAHDSTKGVLKSDDICYYTVERSPSAHSKVEEFNVKGSESNPTVTKPYKLSHGPHGAFLNDDMATHPLGHPDEKTHVRTKGVQKSNEICYYTVQNSPISHSKGEKSNVGSSVNNPTARKPYKHCPYGAFPKDDNTSSNNNNNNNKGVQTSEIYDIVQNSPCPHSKVDVSNVRSAESNPTARKAYTRSHYPHGTFLKDDSATHMLGHSDEKAHDSTKGVQKSNDIPYYTIESSPSVDSSVSNSTARKLYKHSHCPYDAFPKDDNSSNNNKGVQTSEICDTVQNSPSPHSKFEASNVESAESNPTGSKAYRRTYYTYGEFLKDYMATQLLGQSDEKAHDSTKEVQKSNDIHYYAVESSPSAHNKVEEFNVECASTESNPTGRKAYKRSHYPHGAFLKDDSTTHLLGHSYGKAHASTKGVQNSNDIPYYTVESSPSEDSSVRNTTARKPYKHSQCLYGAFPKDDSNGNSNKNNNNNNKGVQTSKIYDSVQSPHSKFEVSNVESAESNPTDRKAYKRTYDMYGEFLKDYMATQLLGHSDEKAHDSTKGVQKSNDVPYYTVESSPSAHSEVEEFNIESSECNPIVRKPYKRSHGPCGAFLKDDMATHPLGHSEEKAHNNTKGVQKCYEICYYTVETSPTSHSSVEVSKVKINHPTSAEINATDIKPNKSTLCSYGTTKISHSQRRWHYYRSQRRTYLKVEPNRYKLNRTPLTYERKEPPSVRSQSENSLEAENDSHKNTG